ncbi:glycoside hydrolase N-terminal domain-containing protein [Gaetbulibacter sp. M240]|uniref:glycosyl hydrolase family 95 catalytic domain-containing protein n=1 Tax=Gaetbulibacter sp. M240 TaxID=3126511 RepID=UPI00374F9079
MKNIVLITLLLIIYCKTYAQSDSEQRVYRIWDNKPALNRGPDFTKIKARGFPYDADWESESYPIGNGYMGANVFGRTDIERIQVTEKTLSNLGPYSAGGLTNFEEIYLSFGHFDPKNYKRSLNLNEGILQVDYDFNGVHYTREYLANYPENVFAIKLTSSKKRRLSFTISAEVPYRRSENEKFTRYGKTNATTDLITLSGSIPDYSQNYESQIKVIADGGKLIAINDNARAGISVVEANSVVIIIAAGTNYELSEHIFSEKINEKKLDPNVYPHHKISKRINRATTLGFDKLKQSHLNDYQNLFSRAQINLSPEVSEIPTRELLELAKNGQSSRYLEELMFQFGRYLLISSSRKGTLPSGLQGVWSQYKISPWSGGYWHNINVQMNYWGAFNTNLAETFIPYTEYYEVYRPQAESFATNYIKKNNPSALNENGDNGWAIGTGATVFNIQGPGGHSGPGTGGFTAKLFWDHFAFTQDTTYLREIAYPALLGMSKFLSKTLKPEKNNLLLVEPSASPEIKVKNEEGKYSGPFHITKGTTFDQGFVWETFQDLLKAAEILNAKDEILDVIRDQINRLDPILIGASGQIKEFREENEYGEIGDPHHRHVSHLCPLFPGTLINSSHPEWLQATRVVLDYRGNNTTGWALVHRLNLRARTFDAPKALEVFQKLIKDHTLSNLWTVHPPFQIDANLGLVSGVAEMLLQSHEGYIHVLPTLPKEWNTGKFHGLVARGNFEITASWENGSVKSLTVLSNKGGKCRIKCDRMVDFIIRDQSGNKILYQRESGNIISFNTKKGEEYKIL